MCAVPSYALITPARNEAKFIELTIKSVVAQTVRPVKWVIVSDGSTDGTDEIVRRYAAEHAWIELVRMPERRERNFAGKVQAFNAGRQRLQKNSYEIIGNLDADVSFDKAYFAFLLEKFVQDPRLGIAGTRFDEAGQEYDYRYTSPNHVSGPCQLFRRSCFEEIGGYRAVKGGGIDVIAVISARMRGWRTHTFTEMSYHHLRAMGSATSDTLGAKFRIGRKDFALGDHPLWECCRTLYQMTRKPYVLGGLALATGYLYALIRDHTRPVSNDFVQFMRSDQMSRLAKLLLSPIKSDGGFGKPAINR